MERLECLMKNTNFKVFSLFQLLQLARPEIRDKNQSKSVEVAGTSEGVTTLPR